MLYLECSGMKNRILIPLLIFFLRTCLPYVIWICFFFFFNDTYYCQIVLLFITYLVTSFAKFLEIVLVFWKNTLDFWHLFWVTISAASCIANGLGIVDINHFFWLRFFHLSSIFKPCCLALYCGSSFPELFIIVWSWMEQYVFFATAH